MGMMLKRGRERALEAEREAETEEPVAEPEADATKPEAEVKKPTKLKRAASSEK